MGNFKNNLISNLPYIALLTYCFLGALVMWQIEARARSSLVLDHRTGFEDPHKCIGGDGYGYAAALYYMISMCTTVGFGVLYPCTPVTRGISVLMSLFGVPLTLVVLDKLGALFTKLIEKVFIFGALLRNIAMRRKSLSRNASKNIKPLEKSVSVSVMSVNPVSENNICDADTPSVELEVPIFIGVMCTGTCILSCSLFYFFAERYEAWESAYFTALTFLTGDFAATNFAAANPMFVIVFAGFSMLSTTISIIQHNIGLLVKRAKTRVEKEVIEAIRTADGRTPEEIVDQVLSRYSRWERALIPQRDLASLQDVGEMVAETAQLELETEEVSKQFDETLDKLRADVETKLQETGAVLVVSARSGESAAHTTARTQCDIQRMDTVSVATTCNLYNCSDCETNTD